MSTPALQTMVNVQVDRAAGQIVFMLPAGIGVEPGGGFAVSLHEAKILLKTLTEAILQLRAVIDFAYFMGFHGMRLRVPHDPLASASLVPPHSATLGKAWPAYNGPSGFSVSSEEVKTALESGRLRKFNELRENDFCGWRECGYDGENADFYSMVS
jgi:hypothetical protein